MDDKVIALGSTVLYFGTVVDHHGRYRVSKVPKNPAGRGYILANEDLRLVNVHRNSIILIPD